MRAEDHPSGHFLARDQDAIPPEASLYHEIAALATRRRIWVIDFLANLTPFRNLNAVKVFLFFPLSQAG